MNVLGKVDDGNEKIREASIRSLKVLHSKCGPNDDVQGAFTGN